MQYHRLQHTITEYDSLAFLYDIFMKRPVLNTLIRINTNKATC